MILRVGDGPPPWAEALYAAGGRFVKEAGDPEVAYNLVGTLYLSKSGWLLLSVPNAMAIGMFKAMNEPGIELPPGADDGPFNAHVTVMSPEDVEAAGGADRISERGKQFAYTLGKFVSVEPDGWSDVRTVWFVKVHSTELQALRRSYGLSSLPRDGEHDFHVSVAIRRKGVLGRNEKKKEVSVT